MDEFERIVNEGGEQDPSSGQTTPWSEAQRRALEAGYDHAEQKYGDIQQSKRLPTLDDLVSVADSRDLDRQLFVFGFIVSVARFVDSVPGLQTGDLGAAIERRNKQVEMDVESSSGGRTFIEKGWNVGWPKCFRKVLPSHDQLVAVAKNRGLDPEKFVEGAAEGVRWMRHRDKLSGLDNDPA